MGKRFAPLELELIEEGRLIRDVDDALKEATRKLLWHCKKYGEAAAKSKAEVNVKLVISHGKAEEDFSVKSSISLKIPGRPDQITIAIHEIEQDGQPTLFVRASGSTEETPRQGRLATDDGRAIDPDSGKAVDPPKADGKAPKPKKEG